MKKSIFRVMTFSLAVILFISLSACHQVKQESMPEPIDRSLDINAIADQYVVNLFKFNPEMSTFNQVEHPDNVNLTDISPAGLERMEAAEDALYEKLKAVEYAQLDKNQQITYQLLNSQISGSIKSRICNRHLWSMNHLDAFYTWYRYIGQTQPVGDAAARSNALARWAKIPEYIRNDLANNRKGLAMGYALPRVVVEKVIAQMDQLLAMRLEENVFYMPAMRDKDAAFQNQMKKHIESHIMPEIKKYRAFMQDEYLDKARVELSITALPDGEACYAALLSASTTLSNTPAEIYAWGEAAIAERETMIKSLGAELYGTGDLSEIKSAFTSDKNNYFSTKAEILTAAQAAIDLAKVKSRDYFNLYPKSDVVLEPVPKIEVKTGYSRYLPASEDGSRPATYMQATYPPEKQVKGNIISTAYHETYPGHHLQIAISRELVKSHPVTKYLGNSGFSEGWARYSESLADEIGLYASASQRIAMYMGLPTGMVVDPGIHFNNWTREEAIKYTLSKQTAMPREDAERYVDRISVWPGQMTTYGVGERFFINLRRQAERQLGDDFDIKAFHDACLKNGSIPLDYISEQVTAYINSQ